MTLVERLRARTKRTLPNDWKKGRQCPECDSSADRPKCFFDMGAACPRHDPDNYEPSPYVIVPDPDCKDAADRIEQLEAVSKLWLEKTEWVQQTSQAHELGLHRADILRTRIEQLEAEIAQLKEEIADLHYDAQAALGEQS